MKRNIPDNVQNVARTFCVWDSIDIMQIAKMYFNPKLIALFMPHVFNLSSYFIVRVLRIPVFVFHFFV